MSTLTPVDRLASRPTRARPDPRRHEPVTRRRSREIWVILGLVAVTGVVHGLNIAGWPAFFDDEGTYLSQAFATYGGDLAPYTYWYDHPPAGWIQLASLAWLPAHFVETQLVAGPTRDAAGRDGLGRARLHRRPPAASCAVASRWRPPCCGRCRR